MSVAYVDTSIVVALEFEEHGGVESAERMNDFSDLHSSNLLEAEVRAAFAREHRRFDPSILARIQWVFPSRPLAAEMATVLQAGYLRGADLWHVAVALHLARNPADICFLTLDQRQREVAASLGFEV